MKIYDDVLNEWSGWEWNRKLKVYEGYYVEYREQITPTNKNIFELIVGRLVAAISILRGRSCIYTNYREENWRFVRAAGGFLRETRTYYRATDPAPCLMKGRKKKRGEK